MTGIVSIALALVVLIVIATGVAMNELEELARSIKSKKLLFASLIIGLSVSLPEIFIGISSALAGIPQLSIGNVIGANIANLSWVIGGAALAGGVIPVVGDYLREDLWVSMILILTPFLLMTDGTLSRFDAIVLLFGYLLYLNDWIAKGKFKIKQAKIEKHVVRNRTASERKILGVVKLVVALGVLLYCSSKLVGIMSQMAMKWGVSDFWMGLTVLAIATTLPELVFVLEELWANKMSLILESVLGSLVANSTLVIALVALIKPMQLSETVQRGVSGVAIVGVLGLFWLFTRSKHRLDRWEGAVLTGVYMMFLGVLFLMLR